MLKKLIKKQATLYLNVIYSSKGLVLHFIFIKQNPI